MSHGSLGSPSISYAKWGTPACRVLVWCYGIVIAYSCWLSVEQEQHYITLLSVEQEQNHITLLSVQQEQNHILYIHITLLKHITLLSVEQEQNHVRFVHCRARTRYFRRHKRFWKRANSRTTTSSNKALALNRVLTLFQYVLEACPARPQISSDENG